MGVSFGGGGKIHTQFSIGSSLLLGLLDLVSLVLVLLQSGIVRADHALGCLLHCLISKFGCVARRLMLLTPNFLVFFATPILMDGD